MRGSEEPVYAVVPAIKSLQESPPLKQGAKRTANGVVKDVGVGMGNNVVPPRVGDEYAAAAGRRPKSNSRAAEISAQLKTQLAYAMVKVCIRLHVRNQYMRGIFANRTVSWR
jgi:hypothetical protein